MTSEQRGGAGRAYIFLNGEFEKPVFGWPEKPGAGEVVIAADGGARHARALDWPVHSLIGDLDSLDLRLLADLEKAGTEIIKYPAEKDEIDFELALGLALGRGCTKIEVLGALGGRWDMCFGNLFLPRAEGFAGEYVRFRHGPWVFQTVGGPAELNIDGRRGDLLSLLPLGEDVAGVGLEGCRYPLTGEILKAGLSRGLSNELVENQARLSFASGTLLIMHKSLGQTPNASDF